MRAGGGGRRGGAGAGTWRRVEVDAVAGKQFLDELEVFQAVLHAAVHELHVLLPHAALDGPGHLHLLQQEEQGEVCDTGQGAYSFG